jgi:hypothetical protein
MDALHDAIALNNKAVEWMRNGNNDSALSEVNRSIFLLRSLGEKLPPATMQTAQDSSPSAPCILFIPQCLRLFELQDDRWFVYNHPLALSKDCKLANPADLEMTICIASATVLFNFALLWHCQGIKTGQGLPLERARQLYELVVTVLENMESDEEMPGVLECLAWNNLAHIHYELGDHAQSQSCNDHVAEILLSTGCHLEAYLDSMDAEDVRFNMEYVRCPSTARAA